MKILVVEDDDNLRTQLESQLVEQDYVVETCADGVEAEFMGTEYPYDLAIVDLGLPELSGIEVIKRWRAKGVDFPILVLTARGDWQDKVEGLEAGADDYLVKPFHPQELGARLNALLRRAAGHAQPELTFGPIQLNTVAKRVAVNGETVNLTSYEYRMLEYMALNAGKTLSKTELTEHLYHQDYDRDSNVLEVFVRRLRRKLDPEQTLNPITTVRGMGYCFDISASE